MIWPQNSWVQGGVMQIGCVWTSLFNWISPEREEHGVYEKPFKLSYWVGYFLQLKLVYRLIRFHCRGDFFWKIYQI